MGVFSFDSNNSHYSYLNGIESPELTLKEKTLKEAIFKALEKIDVIPRMRYNTTTNKMELDLDYVNKLKNLIDSENIFTTKSRTQDTSLYATEMESELLNVTNIGDENEAVEIYPSKGIFTTLRSTSFIFDFTKSYIPTPKRINYVSKVLSLNKFRLVVEDGGVFYYQSDKRFYYYDTSNPRPTTGISDWFYVDLDDSENVYFWDGTAYVNSTQDTNEQGKVRMIATFNDFSLTDTIFRDQDVYIARDTGQAYTYNGSFQKVDCFNEYGDFIIDLSDRVLEKQLYDLLDGDSRIATGDRYDPDNFYQSNTIYFNYRNKNVTTGETTGLLDITPVLEIVLDLSAFTTLKNNLHIPTSMSYNNSIFSYTGFDKNNLLFQVHYTSIPVSVRASIDRKDTDDIDRYSTILNNQGERIIDLSSVLDNMEGKINKIGNSDLNVSHRVLSLSDLYQVGDYTEDGFVVTNRELIFLRDYIDAKYELTKNYNRLSKFIGVQSEVRQYEMGEQNTLQRKLMFSEYVEVGVYNSTNSPNGINTSLLINEIGTNSFISTLDNNTIYEPIRGGIFTTDKIFTWVLASFSSNGGGNSLIFEMQLPGNKSAGETLQTETSLWGTQKGRSVKQYTDDSGKFEEMKIKLLNNFNPPYQDEETSILYGDVFPEVDLNYIGDEYISNEDVSPFKVFKDNREEIGMTIQIKGISKDYSKLIFGDKFFKRNSLVTELQPTSINVHVYNEKVFDKTTTKKVPSGSTQSTLNGTFDYTNNKIIINNSLAPYKSWCLADENDNILIAVNQGDEELNTLVFDFVNKRSNINYNY